MESVFCIGLVAFVIPLLAGCMPVGDPAIGSKGFREGFDGKSLAELWTKTGGNYRVEKGQLRVQGARNHPLWLRRKLPRDARIELNVRSESAEGDIKIELYGDGNSKATAASYTATSYVVVLGGWNNTKNIIARMDEHGADRVLGPVRRIQPGKTYHLRIERKGAAVTVWVDGERWMEMKDEEPLEGRGHDHFAFNNWQSELWFDNLRITPL